MIISVISSHLLLPVMWGNETWIKMAAMADDIFKCSFFIENSFVLIKISLQFINSGQINKESSLASSSSHNLNQCWQGSLIQYVVTRNNILITAVMEVMFLGHVVYHTQMWYIKFFDIHNLWSLSNLKGMYLLIWQSSYTDLVNSVRPEEN